MGASFIAAMQHAGLKIAVLEKQLPEAIVSGQDQRPISLSDSTIVALKNLNLWPDIAAHAGPICAVHISERGRFGSLYLKAEDAKLDALGHVVPYGLLQRQLYECAMLHATCVTVNDINKISQDRKKVTVYADTHAGEHVLEAKYLIAADGMHSRCRDLLDIGVKETSHDDVALSAVLTMKHAHDGMAFERFTKSGVLALLPMWDAKQYRLVWTLDKASAESIEAHEIRQVVHDNFSSRIGLVDGIQFSGKYPLQTMIADQQVKDNVVLLGDSAHRLYPIAAQGYNLAIRDIAVLVDVIQQRLPLSQYVKARQPDQKFIAEFTQGLEMIFGLNIPLLDHLRSTSLLAIDCSSRLKSFLLQKLLGRMDSQPELLCRE